MNILSKFTFTLLLLFLHFAVHCQTRQDTLNKIQEYYNFALGKTVAELLSKYNLDTTSNFEADEKLVYFSFDLGFYCCPRIACKNNNYGYWKQLLNQPIVYVETYNENGILKQIKTKGIRKKDYLPE